jgi:hypothetical protein
MTIKAQKHIHKFKRLKYKSGNVTFFCTLPDCSQKINPALALGKRSLCWRCGDEFIMNEYSLRLAKPHCENCHKPKIQIETFGGGPINAIIVDKITHSPQSLAERLQQTVNMNLPQEIEDEI